MLGSCPFRKAHPPIFMLDAVQVWMMSSKGAGLDTEDARRERAETEYLPVGMK